MESRVTGCPDTDIIATHILTLFCFGSCIDVVMIIDDCESHSRCQDRKSLNSPSLDILFKMFRTKKGEYVSTTLRQKFELKTSFDLYEVKLPTSDTTSITVNQEKSMCINGVFTS